MFEYCKAFSYQNVLHKNQNDFLHLNGKNLTWISWAGHVKITASFKHSNGISGLEVDQRITVWKVLHELASQRWDPLQFLSTIDICNLNYLTKYKLYSNILKIRIIIESHPSIPFPNHQTKSRFNFNTNIWRLPTSFQKILAWFLEISSKKKRNLFFL